VAGLPGTQIKEQNIFKRRKHDQNLTAQNHTPVTANVTGHASNPYLPEANYQRSKAGGERVAVKWAEQGYVCPGLIWQEMMRGLLWVVWSLTILVTGCNREPLGQRRQNTRSSLPVMDGLAFIWTRMLMPG
jgi:hypothetical protein